ncbi:MAG: hypothetical protein ACREEC_02890 [Thermoplasmata archaeon]
MSCDVRPGGRITVYLPQPVVSRIDAESRRLHYLFGGVSRSRLVAELVDVGFRHLPEVVDRLSHERVDGRSLRARSAGQRSD